MVGGGWCVVRYASCRVVMGEHARSVHLAHACEYTCAWAAAAAELTDMLSAPYSPPGIKVARTWKRDALLKLPPCNSCPPEAHLLSHTKRTHQTTAGTAPLCSEVLVLVGSRAITGYWCPHQHSDIRSRF